MADKEVSLALSDEAQKRVSLLDAYDKLTHTERSARNEAITLHDEKWSEKWINFQGELELSRSELYKKYELERVSIAHIGSYVNKDVAEKTEEYFKEKDSDAKAADEKLPIIKPWLDYLLEEKDKNPSDPTFDSMIKEARASKVQSIDGFRKSPPPNQVLTDLQLRAEKDGTLAYMRGLSVVIKDVGSRLDVKKNDDRDIEAALKIAAQKFDVSQGLMLTGDLAFKARAAEIAGKLGYAIQNSEPEVLRAWQKGVETSAIGRFVQLAKPSVESGITGNLLNRSVTKSNEIFLRADSHTLNALGQNPLAIASTHIVGDTLSMPSDRVLAASAAIREAKFDSLDILSRADISMADGGFSDAEKKTLQNDGLIKDGVLTPQALDVIVVRDDRIIKAREGMTLEQKQSLGVGYRTSGDYLRELATASKGVDAKQADVKVVEKKTDVEIQRNQQKTETLEQVPIASKAKDGGLSIGKNIINSEQVKAPEIEMESNEEVKEAAPILKMPVKRRISRGAGVEL